MLATLSTLTLVPLVLCVGICVPFLGFHLELAYRHEQHQLHALEAQAALMKSTKRPSTPTVTPSHWR